LQAGRARRRARDSAALLDGGTIQACTTTIASLPYSARLLRHSPSPPSSAAGRPVRSRTQVARPVDRAPAPAATRRAAATPPPALGQGVRQAAAAHLGPDPVVVRSRRPEPRRATNRRTTPATANAYFAVTTCGIAMARSSPSALPLSQTTSLRAWVGMRDRPVQVSSRTNVTCPARTAGVRSIFACRRRCGRATGASRSTI
jgi:hypothetical protein